MAERLPGKGTSGRYSEVTRVARELFLEVAPARRNPPEYAPDIGQRSGS